MPEIPDLEVYLETIGAKVVGRVMARIRVASPFVLRTAVPKISEAEGRRVLSLHRLGKRIVFELEGGLFLVVHLMIAGRFKWRSRDTKAGQGAAPKLPGKLGLAAFDFEHGSLLLTEASTRKRASIHLLEGTAALSAHDPGGVEPLAVSRAEFAAALQRESHTIKRTLTDPHLFAGIGNAYSDEILHRARMSPTKLTRHFSEEDVARLHDATVKTLLEWIARLRAEAAGEVPEKVTAFHPEMAVHGRYGKPCPVCGARVQRIVHAANEANYCAQCQTGGKLLADRALSRLLKGDWPRSLDDFDAELEKRKQV